MVYTYIYIILGPTKGSPPSRETTICIYVRCSTIGSDHPRKPVKPQPEDVSPSFKSNLHLLSHLFLYYWEYVPRVGELKFKFSGCLAVLVEQTPERLQIATYQQRKD